MKRISLLFACLLALSSAFAAVPGEVVFTPNRPPGAVGLAWDASPDAASGIVTGYFIYWGVSTRTYTNKEAAGNVLTHQVNNLARGVEYFFTATAHDAEGLESEYCNEVKTTLKGFPASPGELEGTNAVVVKVSLQSAPAPTGPWSKFADLGASTESPGFYRSLVAIEAANKPDASRRIIWDPPPYPPIKDLPLKKLHSPKAKG